MEQKKHNEYMRTYMREYRKRPEVREKRNQWEREYSKRPERKEKRREYESRPKVRKRKRQRDVRYRAQLRERVLALYGGKCACCGSLEKLGLDHIKPVLRSGPSRASDSACRAALRQPERFQLLCDSCNRWKGIGPRCPCHWWDEISPGWRKRYERRRADAGAMSL